jgi:hypothetical protein
MKVRSYILMSALLVVGGQAKGQYAVGDTMPLPSLDGFAQTGATSAADLAGRAVLYEFFAYW